MTEYDSDLSDLEEIAIVAAAHHLLKSAPKKRKCHVRNYYAERSTKGRCVKDFDDLVKEPDLFKRTFRMTHENFMYIYDLVHEKLAPKPHARKDSLIPKEKLMVTLEFLATGNWYRTLSDNYRFSKQAITNVLHQTCDEIIKALQPLYMPAYNETSWLETANKYHTRWNLPNCLGAIDGKHIMLTCPDKSGSLFYNYKGYHSIVLMAVADSEYRFWYTDIGQYGSESDAAVFKNTEFARALANEELSLPEDCIINGRPVPFFFVADDAFPLGKRIMKNYASTKKVGPITEAQDVFNYRMNRARRCVENAFGILVAKWGVLSKKMFISPELAQKVVEACCVLHNYLLTESRASYTPPGFVDTYDENGTLVQGQWRSLKIPEDENTGRPKSITAEKQGRPSDAAKSARDHLCHYFNAPEGKVPWQDKRVFGTRTGRK